MSSTETTPDELEEEELLVYAEQCAALKEFADLDDIDFTADDWATLSDIDDFDIPQDAPDQMRETSDMDVS